MLKHSQSISIFFVCCFLVFSLSSNVFSLPGDPLLEPSDQNIRIAIEKGRNYLLVNTAWRSYQSADQFLITLALLRAHGDIHSGGDYSQELMLYIDAALFTDPGERTYGHGLKLLMLLSIDVNSEYYFARQTDINIARDSSADWLVRTQKDETEGIIESSPSYGGWRYPAGEDDLSNTQYAMMGLWAAQLLEYPVPIETWEKAATYLSRMQDKHWGLPSPDGGFVYENNGLVVWGGENGHSYASMTAAGLFGFAAIQAVLGPSYNAMGKTVSSRILWTQKWLGDTQRYTLGNDFTLNETWSLALNWYETSTGGRASFSANYYHIYGLERALVVSGVPADALLEGHNWYRDIAYWLINTQNPDGSWDRTCYNNSNLFYNTAFAMLTLSKSAEEFYGAYQKPPQGAIAIPKKALSASLTPFQKSAFGRFIFDHDIATFDPSKHTTILVHGWNAERGDELPPYVTYMYDWIKEDGRSNVLIWEWLDEASTLLPPRKEITTQQGAVLADRLAALLPITYSQKIHFIAHSAGAKLSYEAINRLVNKYGRQVDLFSSLDAYLFDATKLGSMVGSMTSVFGLVPMSKASFHDDYAAGVGAINAVFTLGTSLSPLINGSLSQ